MPDRSQIIFDDGHAVRRKSGASRVLAAPRARRRSRYEVPAGSMRKRNPAAGWRLTPGGCDGGSNAKKAPADAGTFDLLGKQRSVPGGDRATPVEAVDEFGRG